MSVSRKSHNIQAKCIMHTILTVSVNPNKLIQLFQYVNVCMCNVSQSPSHVLHTQRREKRVQISLTGNVFIPGVNTYKIICIN